MAKRNTFIDVLKGLCIIFVIITHLEWSGYQRALYLFPFWIQMAVPIFMIISGYVYSFSYKKSNISHISEAYTAKSILNKFIRYTLPFAIIYVLELILYGVLGRLSDQSVPEIIYNWFIRFLRGGYGPGSYYYPLLVQFIFLFPVIYFIIKKYKYKGLVLCCVINLAYEILHTAYRMDSGFYRLMIFRYILVIAVGCYMACEEYVFNLKRELIIFIIGTAFIIADRYLGYTPIFITDWATTSFLGCFFLIPIMMVLLDKCKHVKCPPLELCGKASYNIFLVQMVWYHLASKPIAARVDNIWIMLAINVVVCVGLGIGFYYIEAPITKKVVAMVNGRLDKRNG